MIELAITNTSEGIEELRKKNKQEVLNLFVFYIEIHEYIWRRRGREIER